MKRNAEETSQCRGAYNMRDGLNSAIVGIVAKYFEVDSQLQHCWGGFRGQPAIVSTACTRVGIKVHKDGGFTHQPCCAIYNKSGNGNRANWFKRRHKDINVLFSWRTRQNLNINDAKMQLISQ